jgi:cysteine synthase A
MQHSTTVTHPIVEMSNRDVCSDLSEAIGNTPLVRLRHASARTGCEIFAKAEFMNPGGSVKDRAALAIIEDAERRNVIEPGGMIVEATGGNTGIGLALVGNARGYQTLLVIPETRSSEKISELRALGASVYLVPDVDHDDRNHYKRIAERLARRLEDQTDHGVLWANQFDNSANRQGHFETTGPEIWEQTNHEVDAFICSVGTGGSLAGVSRFLRDQSPDIVVGIADPAGSAMYSYYTSGTLEYRGDSIFEGIGPRYMPKNLEDTRVDFAVRVDDEEALEELYHLAQKEGMAVGGSSGVNVAGAIQMAEVIGPGHTIVTVLCDSASRYGSKLLDSSFLQSRGLEPSPHMQAPKDVQIEIEQLLER